MVHLPLSLSRIGALTEGAETKETDILDELMEEEEDDDDEEATAAATIAAGMEVADDRTAATAAGFMRSTSPRETTSISSSVHRRKI